MAHGVVVVHGIGEQPRGETLSQVVNPVADYLEKAGGANFTLARYASIPAGRDSPAEVTLTFQGITPGGTTIPESQWVFREVWWAQSLQPPSYRDMLRWTLEQFWSQVLSIFKGLRASSGTEGGNVDISLVRPTDTASRPKRAVLKSALAGYQQQLKPVFRVLENATYEGVKDKEVPLPLMLQIYNFLVIPFLELLFFLGAPLVFGLLLLGWVLSLSPNIFGLGVLSQQLEKTLKGFLVLNIGDCKTYIDNGVWAANIRRVLEESIVSMLQNPSIQDITVIAHSWGSVVAYEGLSKGGEVSRFLSQNPLVQKQITLATLGAGLNRVRIMVEGSRSPHAKPRLTRPLIPSILWLNLYSRYDPVSAGRLDPELKAMSGLPDASIMDKRVINLDDPINDHGAYWNNTELVVPRLVRAINGGNAYPFSEATLQPRMVQHRLITVAKIASLRLLFSFASITNAMAAILSEWWRNAIVGVIEAAPLVGKGITEVHSWFQANRILNLNLEPLASWAIVSLVVALIALAIYKIMRYGFWKDI